MRTLWILRHAKAVAHTSEDHDRELAPRGRRQCAELAEHLAGAPGVPTLVVSSSAARAVETADRVLSGLGPGAEVVVEPALYEADVEEVLEVVRRTGDDRPEVMVVGHNPTFEQLALSVLEHDDAAGRRQIEDGLPTCALAVVAFDVEHWARVSAGAGRLRELYVPKVR